MACGVQLNNAGNAGSRDAFGQLQKGYGPQYDSDLLDAPPLTNFRSSF